MTETNTLPVQRAAQSIVTPSKPLIGGLQNADESDIVLPRLHLMQGLPSEVKQHGQIKAGTLFNVMTGEEIDMNKPFAVVTGWKEWICWKADRGTGFEYRTRIKSEVPPADLQWNDNETDPKKRKPRASEYVNWVVLFEGDQLPSVLSFYSTGVQTGKSIQAMVQTYGASRLYQLSTKEKTNSQGSWLGFVVRPAGILPKGEWGEFVSDAQQRFAGRNIDTQIDGTDVDD